MRRRVISLIMAAATYASVVYGSPHTPDALDVINDAAVKSIDEFMARFNGEERHPQVDNDSLSRQNTLFSLFDWGDNPENPRIDRDMAAEFVDSVCVMGNKIGLDNSNVWCEVGCELSLGERRVDVKIILVRELLEGRGARWGIVGVRGLKASGFYSDSLATLSPVDHELGFISFKDWFNSNHRLVPSLRGSTSPIDQKSFLMGMAATGQLKYRFPREMTLHFMDVPGFIFRIRRIVRNTVNTGWLIDSIERAGEFNKLTYLNTLFIE